MRREPAYGLAVAHLIVKGDEVLLGLERAGSNKDLDNLVMGKVEPGDHKGNTLPFHEIVRTAFRMHPRHAQYHHLVQGTLGYGLARETYEEAGVRTQPPEFLCGIQFEPKDELLVQLHIFMSRYTSGTPRSLDKEIDHPHFYHLEQAWRRELTPFAATAIENYKRGRGGLWYDTSGRRLKLCRN